MSESGTAVPVIPHRGEVWFANLDPTQGHEQAGRRPMLIISTDSYNTGSAGIVISLPLTSRLRLLPERVPVQPPEGGLKVASDILCDQVRAISRKRLLRRWGSVEPATLVSVENVLRALLQL